MSTIDFPFWSLKVPERKKIANELLEAYKYKNIKPKQVEAWYLSAISVMTKKKSLDILSKDEKKLLDDLNNAATVQPWRNKQPQVDNLTDYCRVGAKGSTVFGITSAVLALYYMRSHKVITVACLSSSVAWYVMREGCLQLSQTMAQINCHISTFDYWRNQAQFSGQVDEAYTSLEKANYLFSIYFTAQKNRLKGKEHQGLQLLTEQLAAMKYLKIYMQRLFLPPIENDQDEPIELDQLQNFGKKLERLCAWAKKSALGLGLLGVGWTVFTLKQRAYLMAVAGLVHSLAMFNCARVLGHLHMFGRDSKNNPTVEGVTTLFNQTLVKINFNRWVTPSVSEYQFRDTVVIPVDAILKLIPSWNDSK